MYKIDRSGGEGGGQEIVLQEITHMSSKYQI